MIQPLHSLYYVRLLDAPDQTAGGIFLPESARDPVYDGEVIAAGPGSLLPNGARYPMQAQVGDRVIFEKSDWTPLEGQEGFIPDSRLVAVIPGPDQDTVQPANDYVFVLPDRKDRVHESEGGVLVAAYSLAGQDATAKRRGDELHAEFVKLEQTERWREAANEYERHRQCWDFLDGLTAWEREALGAAIERNGRDSKWRHYVPITLAESVKSGTVVAWGPGCLSSPGSYSAVKGNLAKRDGSNRFRGVAYGDRVWFDREYQAVSICDGRRNLLAVKSRFIAAVEA